MPQCIIDLETSPTFRRSLAGLSKKYRKVGSDLELAVSEIEADYSSACYAVANRGFNRMVWEYSFGSSDLRRHPRDSFRVIGAFLGEREGGTMYFILCFFKGDKQSEPNEVIEKAIARAREAAPNK